MASEVIRGGRLDKRSFRNAGLVMLAIMWTLALVLVVDGSDPYPDIMVPALMLAGVGLFLVWARAIPWVESSWAMEVSPDVIRWRGGWRRRDRVIHRAQVVSSKAGRSRFLEVRFYDAAGERVGMLPVFHFQPGRVFAALRRFEWPVPELDAFADSVQWP